MARTDKWTVREGAPEARWFTHNGVFGSDPSKVKKNGAGKGNWGQPGDELLDSEEEYHMFGKSGRRNSNHQENERDIKARAKMIEDHFFRPNEEELA